MKSKQNIEEKLSEYFPDLKNYQFNRVLGQGGQAVSLLLDHPDGQYVGKLFEFPPTLASMFAEGKKIESEAQILKELKHPNIPEIRETIEGDDALLSVREYIPGKTLDQIISEKNFLSESEVIPIMNSVLNILDYLHSPEQHRNIGEPVIHRDIKPQNIVVNDKGVYLIDFGTSHFKKRSFTTVSAKGTFEYMAPEQFAGMAYPASDLYGLGATMITALLGQTPQEILLNQKVTIPYRNFISNKTKDILERMVDPNTKSRYSSVSSVKNALKSDVKSQGFNMKKTFASMPKPIRKTLTYLSGAALVLTLLGNLFFSSDNVLKKQTLNLNVHGIYTTSEQTLSQIQKPDAGVYWIKNAINQYDGYTFFDDNSLFKAALDRKMIKKADYDAFVLAASQAHTILADPENKKIFHKYTNKFETWLEKDIKEVEAYNKYANTLEKLFGICKIQIDNIFQDVNNSYDASCETVECLKKKIIVKKSFNAIDNINEYFEKITEYHKPKIRNGIQFTKAYDKLVEQVAKSLYGY